MIKKPALASAEEFLTVAEAAEFLGISSWTLRNWDKAGRLRPKRHPVNGYRIYRREELLDVLSAETALKSRKETLAGRFDWDRNSGTRHFVQFYETPRYLADVVSSFIETGLRVGDAALLFAGGENRSRIERKLRARGINVAALLEEGRYVPWEPRDALARCMRNGLLDERLLRSEIASVVHDLTRRFAGVRIVGGIGALLWEEGNRHAARQLETFWNELAKTQSFALLWTYPLASFSDVLDGVALNDICHRQSPSDAPHHTANFSAGDAAGGPEHETSAGMDQLFAGQAKDVLQDLCENAPEAMHRLGPDGRILWANRAELSLLGYAATEYIGRHIGEFHVSQGLVTDFLEKLAKGEVLIDYPARLRCKDNSIKDVLINGNGRVAGGALLYSRCFTREATARVRAEEAARESERRFSRFMQCVPGLAWIKDLEGRYVYANDSVLRPFGTTRGELYGKTDEDLFDPETARQFRENDRRALLAENGIQTVEVFRHSDGTLHRSLVSKFAIPGVNGKPEYIGGMAIDLNESLAVPSVRAALEESEVFRTR